MTDDELIEKMYAECLRYPSYQDGLRAALAIARPIIRADTLAEAAAICDKIAAGPDIFNGSCRGAINKAAIAIRKCR